MADTTGHVSANDRYAVVDRPSDVDVPSLRDEFRVGVNPTMIVTVLLASGASTVTS